jgi:aspartyl-tRNA synthetase
MARYGSDKPDLRYGLASEDLSDVFGETEFGVFRNALGRGAQIRGMRVPGGAAYSRRVIDELTEIAKGQKAGGLAWAAVEPGELRSSFARFLSDGERAAMLERLGAREGDLVLLVAETPPVPSLALGAIRTELAKRENLADPDTLAFARVTDFPLLEWDEDGKRWNAMHHPFTSPMDEDVGLLEDRPGDVRAKAYDLVCNGWELGGGSIRIHRRELQERMFRALGYDTEEAEERFGHLLRAFQFGAPPHGGFAVGLDRVVAIFGDEANIREVMAFPKNQSAQDLLMGAPSTVAEAQLRDLYIRTVEPPPERR